MDFCTQLSINLLIDALKKTNNDTNLVFSPMSYDVILNMIAGAASKSTLKEMLEVLGCADIKEVNSNSKKMMSLASDGDESNGRGPVMHCLNGIWLDQRYCLKPSYEKLASKIYKAPVKIADFENEAGKVVVDANEWAKESTKGLVRDVLKRGALRNSIFVLANALYFKGYWKSGFKPAYTENKPFYLMNRRKKPVPFMTGCRNYSHGSFDGFEVVKIPYKRGDNKNSFAMYFLLPDNRFGLDDMLHKVVSDEVFLRSDFNLPEGPSYDSFWIPKFKFSYYTSKGVKGMKKMGLESPFDHGGLTEIVNEKISASKIVQKSFIEVDEKGTEAAVVTCSYGGETGSSGRKRKWKEFIADHPFMFMIREEKSKFIIFTGVVLDPTV